jgi:hypothetical protein
MWQHWVNCFSREFTNCLHMQHSWEACVHLSQWPWVKLRLPCAAPLAPATCTSPPAGFQWSMGPWARSQLATKEDGVSQLSCSPGVASESLHECLQVPRNECHVSHPKLDFMDFVTFWSTKLNGKARFSVRNDSKCVRFSSWNFSFP